MNTMASPNDPVFFFHHSYLDKLWHDWQNVDYSNRLWSYGGVNRDGTTASYNDKIPYYGNQVWTVLPLGNMCYDYGSAAPFKRDAGAVSSANGTALASVARVPVSRRALMTAHANNLVKDSPVEKFVPKIDEPLKHVAPLPDAFIQMNKMDPLLVRRWEFRLNKHINNVNAANGFAASVIALAKP
ncbi:hypothetical protein GQ42DRAFT_32690 [Ramicandelaber brevisporus]|nr:hypothetical protein GQ42DRAFT_32690 [Ramicandelaber brevisporus]